MTALAVSSALLTVEEYLAAEEHAEVKHEYLGGVPHAMAGTSTEHNRIAFNLSGMLHTRLRGRRYEGFGSDMKLKLQISATIYFYYPDAMVACESATLGRSWCENPSVIFEIISESTRSIDEREKSSNYKSIATLDAYVRIEQAERKILVERRTPSGWVHEVLEGAEAALSLPTVGVEFPIAELYERLALP